MRVIIPLLSPSLPSPFLPSPPFSNPSPQIGGVWGNMSPHSGSGAKPQPPNVFLNIQGLTQVLDAVFSDAQTKVKIKQVSRVLLSSFCLWVGHLSWLTHEFLWPIILAVHFLDSRRSAASAEELNYPVVQLMNVVYRVHCVRVTLKCY